MTFRRTLFVVFALIFVFAAAIVPSQKTLAAGDETQGDVTGGDQTQDDPSQGDQLQGDQAQADISAAILALLRGDLSEAQQLADQDVRLATQHGFSMYSALGMIVQGCITVQNGDLETGIKTLKNALQDYRATSAHNLLPVFLSFLAEALSRCGKSEEALAVVAEALRLSETNLNVFWEAELYRLKGELLLVQSSVQRLASSVEKSTKSKVKTKFL